MRHLLLFALASALGGLARYGFSALVSALVKSAFPWGIFLTNILGCFLFGTIWGMASVHRLFSDATRVVLLTGFMGSFTTFSTYALECAELFHRGAAGKAMLNLLLQNTLGILAAWGGLVAGSRFSA